MFANIMKSFARNGRIFKKTEPSVLHPKVVRDIYWEGDNLLFTSEGIRYSIDIKLQSSLLANATESERNNFYVTAIGYGICWPDLDEDLSIDGMIREARVISGKSDGIKI